MLEAEVFIDRGSYRAVAWYGIILLAAGVALGVLAFALFSMCGGSELLLLGVAILLIGGGIALLGGLPALYLMAPLGVIVLALGLVLRATGSC